MQLQGHYLKWLKVVQPSLINEKNYTFPVKLFLKSTSSQMCLMGILSTAITLLCLSKT